MAAISVLKWASTNELPKDFSLGAGLSRTTLFELPQYGLSRESADVQVIHGVPATFFGGICSTAIADENSTNTTALTLLGRLFVLQGELEKARTFFSAVADRAPAGSLVNIDIGDTYDIQGQSLLALRYYRDASFVSRADRFTVNVVLLGRTYMAAGRRDSLATLVEQYTDKLPLDLALWHLVWKAFLGANQYLPWSTAAEEALQEIRANALLTKDAQLQEMYAEAVADLVVSEVWKPDLAQRVVDSWCSMGMDKACEESKTLMTLSYTQDQTDACLPPEQLDDVQIREVILKGIETLGLPPEKSVGIAYNLISEDAPADKDWPQRLGWLWYEIQDQDANKGAYVGEGMGQGSVALDSILRIHGLWADEMPRKPLSRAGYQLFDQSRLIPGFVTLSPNQAHVIMIRYCTMPGMSGVAGVWLGTDPRVSFEKGEDLWLTDTVGRWKTVVAIVHTGISAVRINPTVRLWGAGQAAFDMVGVFTVIGWPIDSSKVQSPAVMIHAN